MTRYKLICIDLDVEEDGRFIAEAAGKVAPGVKAYGATRREALVKVVELIDDVLTERGESGLP